MLDGPVSRSALLEALCGEHVIAFEARAGVAPETLHPEEALAVTRAVRKRLEEFAAGRACARRALECLGVKQFPLRVGPDREPLWPPGITGSITHTRGFCAAAIARSELAGSLGIDAELRDAVHRRLWRSIATEEECARLAALPEREAGEAASLLFSAKESFFKCQYPITRQWLNFRDVSVSIEPGALRIRPQRALELESHAPAPWAGRYAHCGTLILTAMSLPASALGASNSVAAAKVPPRL